MTLRFKSEADAAAWLAQQSKPRPNSPNDARAQWYQDGRDRIEARGERVTTESLRAELKGDKGAREILAFEGEARERDVIAAMAVAGFNQAIASGLQGIIDAAQGEGDYARESLPHYDRIESAASSAALAMESTLPWYHRPRTIAALALVLLVIAVAFLFVNLT